MIDKKIAVIRIVFLGLPIASLCAVKRYQVAGFEASTRGISL